jgi:hypothetical protein
VSKVLGSGSGQGEDVFLGTSATAMSGRTSDDHITYFAFSFVIQMNVAAGLLRTSHRRVIAT